MKIALHSAASHYDEYLNSLGNIFEEHQIIRKGHKSKYSSLRYGNINQMHSELSKCDLVLTNSPFNRNKNYCAGNIMSEYTKSGISIWIGHSMSPPQSVLKKCFSYGFENCYNLFPDFFKDIYEMPKDCFYYKGHFNMLYLYSKEKIKKQEEKILFIPDSDCTDKHEMKKIILELLDICKVTVRPHVRLNQKNKNSGANREGTIKYDFYEKIKNDNADLEIDYGDDIIDQYDNCKYLVSDYPSSICLEFLKRGIINIESKEIAILKGRYKIPDKIGLEAKSSIDVNMFSIPSDSIMENMSINKDETSSSFLNSIETIKEKHRWLVAKNKIA